MLNDYVNFCAVILALPNKGLATINLDAQVALDNVQVPLDEIVKEKCCTMLDEHKSYTEISNALIIPKNIVNTLRRNRSAYILLKKSKKFKLYELLQYVAISEFNRDQATFAKCADLECVLLKLKQICALSNLVMATDPTPSNSTAYSGTYIIDGIKYAFKSKLEAKYACWLQAQKNVGDILSWAYATCNFDLGGKGYYKRWTIDFSVSTAEGQYWVEVTAMRNPVLEKRLELMRYNQPFVKIEVVDATWFKEHEEALALLFDNSKWVPARQVIATSCC